MTSDPEQPETPEGMAAETFIARNREALAAMVAAARDSLDHGDQDSRSIDEIIAEGRARLA